MKTKTLLDTNVFVYAYDIESIFHKKAVVFLSDPTVDFYTSSKNISEYFAVLSKMGEPFDRVFRFYQDIRQNTTLLYPSNASLVKFEGLLKKYQPRGNRVYDIEIVSIALANGISEICTVNTKDFSGVTEITVAPL
ncbi:MAG: type II toxin-antitoxin system VapC family toxin [Saprospiraceae bacterium]|nr:type II toxin-antitoxin system VapC family toxin [Saprospiraceae bacterium]